MPFWGVSAHTFTGERREEWIRNCRKARVGDREVALVGENISYAGIHRRWKRQFPKPDMCQRCGKRKAIDFANKSGDYKLNIEDWWWICRRCHMVIDGRINKRSENGRFY